jgi:hypothetical protein
METRNEFLQTLEEDGKLWAHFFTHHNFPGYYGVLVREKTPEYIYYWLPDGPISSFELSFSMVVPDIDFMDYIEDMFPEQMKGPRYLKTLYKIDDVSHPEEWLVDFKTWKQESIRLSRTKWLEQYPWVLSTKAERF